MPKVCGEMGLYQYEIITKPCLINENMTQVSELIYQEEHASLRIFHGNNTRGKEIFFFFLLFPFSLIEFSVSMSDFTFEKLWGFCVFIQKCGKTAQK